MDWLEGTIERVGTRITIYLSAATAIIGVFQYPTHSTRLPSLTRPSSEGVFLCPGGFMPKHPHEKL